LLADLLPFILRPNDATTPFPLSPLVPTRTPTITRLASTSPLTLTTLTIHTSPTLLLSAQSPPLNGPCPQSPRPSSSLGSACSVQRPSASFNQPSPSSSSLSQHELLSPATTAATAAATTAKRARAALVLAGTPSESAPLPSKRLLRPKAHPSRPYWCSRTCRDRSPSLGHPQNKESTAHHLLVLSGPDNRSRSVVRPMQRPSPESETDTLTQRSSVGRMPRSGRRAERSVACSSPRCCR
jgi:hypothetical protein